MLTLMSSFNLILPSSIEIRQHLVAAFQRFLQQSGGPLLNLPVPVVTNPVFELPLSLVSVPLPEWAVSCGVDGAILIPLEAAPDGVDWQKVDWWLAAFIMLEGWHERLWEDLYGPIHSYSFRLKGWDERVWEHAWVNRIMLFLRSWAAKSAHLHADYLFGPLPLPEILMTHDVDAVEKTLPIRIKQGTFSLINAFRALIKRDFKKTISKISNAFHFLFSRDDWWTLDKLLDIEKMRKVSSRYYFFADNRPKTLSRWLFDPGYDISSLRIRAFFQRLKNSGAVIGLHPSFDSWRDAKKIQLQKMNLESKTSIECSHTRQHWLRFSWRYTWEAQEKAGILEDATLMFNDRPGFRNSAVISWRPWQPDAFSAGKLKVLPTIMMDSHFYDYLSLTDDERQYEMMCLIEECRVVRGQCAVLWHPHTLGKDYGWGQGFDELTKMIASRF